LLFAATLAVPDFLPGGAVALPGQAPSGWPLALRPDGAAVAIGTAGRPTVWHRGRPPALPAALDGPRPLSRVSYSPDGRYLTVAPAEGGLEVWDGDAERRLAAPLPRPEGPVLDVGYADGGATLRAVLADGRVRSWSVPAFGEGPEWSLPRAGTADWSAARIAPDGAAVAAGDRAGRVGRYDGAGRLVRPLSGPEDRLEVQAVAWSPDGQLVAVGCKGGRVRLCRRDGTPVGMFRRAMAVVTGVEFTADGAWLLACGLGAGIDLWDVATGELLLTGPGRTAALSRDGATLARSDWKGVRLDGLLRPAALRVLRGHADAIARLSWSGDGRRLVTLDAAWEVRAWDVRGGTAVDAFPAPVGTFFAGNGVVALNVDGSRLAYASGGERESTAVIRDVAAKSSVGDWRLPGGFEFLAAGGRWGDGQRDGTQRTNRPHNRLP
jgi:WD40 repeat protein